MKKLICVLIAMLLLGQFYLSAITVSNEEIIDLAHIEERYCSSFTIPDNNAICVPEQLFHVLVKTAEETNANIIRTILKDGTNGGYIVDKYILLTAESRYCDEFSMASGRFLTIENSHSKDNIFVASYDSTEQNQLGVIQSHMIGIDVCIYPLFQEFSSFQASGLYYVELPDNCSEEDFRKTLSNNIEMEFGYALEEKELVGTTNIIGLPYVDTFIYQISVMSVFLLTVILMLYYLLHEHKRISVMKLHGMSCRKIVWSIQASFHVVFLAVYVISSAVLFCLSKDVFFCRKLITDGFWLYIGFFGILYFIGLGYVSGCKIISMLKGKTNTTSIVWLNNIVKFVCLILLLYVGQSIFTTSYNIAYNKALLNNWEDVKNYGVFYPLYVGNETTSEERNMTAATINGQLYTYLNKNGALYINARDYHKEVLELDPEFEGYRSVKVNPNYLDVYPLLDSNGNKIVISEDTTSWILLVPEAFSNQEENILLTFNAEREGRRYADEQIYGLETSDTVNNQLIKIIWLKNEQNVFCMNPNIGNMGYLTDVIIQVVTEGNRYVSDTNCILGNGNDDPLKVKLNKDGSTTFSDIENVVGEMGLKDNLKYIA